MGQHAIPCNDAMKITQFAKYEPGSNQVDIAALAGALRTLCGAVPLLFLLEMYEQTTGCYHAPSTGQVPTHTDTVQSVVTMSDYVGTHPIDKRNGNSQLSINWYISRRITEGRHNAEQRCCRIVISWEIQVGPDQGIAIIYWNVVQLYMILWVSITYFFQDLCWHFMTPFQLVILTQVKVCYNVSSLGNL